jgi:hypothetical protein
MALSLLKAHLRLTHRRSSCAPLLLGDGQTKPEGAQRIEPASLPSGRCVTQEDVAAALWYLTGSGSAQLTGSVLNLGGGFGL